MLSDNVSAQKKRRKEKKRKEEKRREEVNEYFFFFGYAIKTTKFYNHNVSELK